MKTICIGWSNCQSVITLGDEIFVKVKNADLVKKQLDFNFIKKIEEPMQKK
jgi:ribonuclease R